MRLGILPQLSVAVILLASTFLLSTENVRAQSGSSAFESGVAVLTNGQTMEGQISRQNNKVIVRLESGSRIHLAQERVLFTAANLSEAYWELAARTGATDLEGQVSVFQWCLRNELFEEGANHLLVLQESKIPARRLAALDLDLEAKKKRADFRHAQATKRATSEKQLAKRAMEERARKERIETLIGGKTSVTIPDLHRVPRRSIRKLKHATSEAVAVSRPQTSDGAEEATAEAIDQFGNRVPRQPRSQEIIRQVNYEQPIFSSPAIPRPEKGDASKDSKLPLAGRLTNSKIARIIPKTNSQTSSIDSGFSVTRSDTNDASPEEVAEPMADPFDANYFNQRFATPAVDEK